MGIICPDCGHENLTRGRFCNNCGEPIWLECPRCQEYYPAGAQFCSHCKYPVQVVPATEKCPACQKVIPSGTTSCDFCQTSLIVSPVLQVTPDRLDFGKVGLSGHPLNPDCSHGTSWYYEAYRHISSSLFKRELGSPVILTLYVAKTGGRRLDIVVQKPDWIDDVSDDQIRRGGWGGCSGRVGGDKSERCQVTLNGCRLHELRGRHHSDNIVITSNGGNATIPVTVEVVR